MRHFTKSDPSPGEPTIAIHRSPLFTGTDAERALDLGKIQNLRIVARCLDGLLLQSGEEFSFWKHVGHCTTQRGFVTGRQLQEGCLIPAIGGGICQLSNALYDVALQAGFEITERHRHTRVIAGSLAERDRDATVAWNHLDLRFRSNQRARLSVKLTADSLIVTVTGNAVNPRTAKFAEMRVLRTAIDSSHACGTCQQVDCRLFAKGCERRDEANAYLVEEFWPEFDEFIQRELRPSDVLFRPFDGVRFRRPAYAWTNDGFGTTFEATGTTLLNAVHARTARNIPRQATRQECLRRLAEAYTKRIPASVTHLVVAMDLLPYLAREGALGGRTYDVLVTRAPIGELQSNLDRALREHPDRHLLGDFRADPELVDLEREALSAASRLITPHPHLMASDPRRVLLEWAKPKPVAWNAGPIVAFPGPTVSRKGAFEVRAAVRSLGVPVRPLGSQLEGPDFWSGCEVVLLDGGWLDGIGVVVQPAVVEDRPRKLLQAVAAGCPVICTAACGLPAGPLVTLVEPGDAAGLTAAISRVLNRASCEQAVTV